MSMGIISRTYWKLRQKISFVGGFNPSEKWWSSSVGIMTFPTEWIKNVPNHQHQPVFCCWRLKFIQFSQATVKACPRLAFLINESILGKCFRSSPSLTNPGNSPLTVKYDCPQLSLSIITSALETNKIELRSYLIIPCSASPGLFVDPHLLVVPAPLQAVRRPRGVRRPWSTAMAQIWGCIIYYTGWWCNNHLEKYEFVNGKDYISHIFWKIKKMFETTH